MGFIDRIQSYAEQLTGSSHGENTARDKGTRSPQELDLIERLQAHLADANRADCVRFHLRFVGTVQGVGFRWTNQGTARELHLTGWVINRTDGSVEMELQGPAGALIKHLDAVHTYYARMGCRVWLDSATEQPLRADETEFSVRY